MELSLPSCHADIHHDMKYDDICSLVWKAVQNLHWSIEEEDSNHLVVTTPTGKQSWGEKVHIHFLPEGYLSVTSKCTQFQLSDGGKNKKNIEEFIDELKIHSENKTVDVLEVSEKKSALQNAWVWFTLIPLVNSLVFFYIGSKTNNKKWKISGGIYLAALVFYYAAFFMAGENSQITHIGAFVFSVSWIASIVHAFKVRKDFLIKLEAQNDSLRKTRE